MQVKNEKLYSYDNDGNIIVGLKLEQYLDKAFAAALELKCEGTFQLRVDIEKLACVDEGDDKLITYLGYLLEQSWQEAFEQHSNVVDENKKNSILQQFKHWHFREPELIYKLFEDQVGCLDDEHLAIIYNEERWSYRKLNQHANQLAKQLLELKELNNWSDHITIGLFFENCPEVIVCILAIMKAGFSFVTITNDEKLKNERLALYIKESQPKLLIVQDKLIYHGLKYFIEGDSQLKSLLIRSYQELQKEFLNFDTSNLNLEIQNTQKAYVMFTSGSTGIPKGSEIPHQGLSARVQYVKEMFKITNKQRVGWYSLLTFDACILDIMTALGTGATCVIIPNEIRTDFNKLAAYLNKHEVNIITLVPSVLEKIDFTKITTLKSIISTGEKGNEAFFNKLKEQYGDQIIIENGYGPTEFMICFSMAEIKKSQAIHIGSKPVSGTYGYLLNKSNDSDKYPINPFKVNLETEGELYLSGSGRALGYINKKEEYNQRFRCIPHPNFPGKKIKILIYQTGDIFRQDKDRNLNFIGRIDEQYKYLGELIHPMAIETALLDFKLNNKDVLSTTKVIIEKIESISKVPIIKAYIEITKNENLELNDLIRDLNFYLRHHPYCTFVPSRYLFIKSWPTNVNGKKEKSGLELQKVYEQVCYANSPLQILPRSDVEKMIADIWQEILEIPKSEYVICVDDNFFDLGGDSLRVDKMLADVSKVYPSYYKERHQFINFPTLRSLAFRVQKEDVLLKSPSVCWWSKSNDFELSIKQDKFPIILVHSLTGYATSEYEHIAQHILKNMLGWPLLYTKSVSLDNSGYIVHSLTDLATDLIKSLDSVLNSYQGPVILIGYSAAGTLAYEMTRLLQLKRNAAVCCIDTLSPNYYITLRQDEYAAEIVKMMHHLGDPAYLQNTITKEQLQKYSKSEQFEIYWKELFKTLCKVSVNREEHEIYLGKFATLYNLTQTQFSYNPDSIDNAVLISFSETIHKSNNRLCWDDKLPIAVRQLDGLHSAVIKNQDWVSRDLMPKIVTFCNEASSQFQLQSIIKHQKELYNSFSTFPKNVGPFINLLCVKKHQNNANPSQGISCTNVMELANKILNNKSKNPIKVLLTGGKGAGKSYFCQYLARKSFVNNDDSFFKPILLNIEELNPNEIPEDLIKVKAKLDVLAQDILFVIDGYDVLDVHTPLGDFIRQLLGNKNTSVILTSQPGVANLIKLAKFNECYDLKISFENINMYVTHVFSSNIDRASQIINCINGVSLSKITPYVVSIICDFGLQQDSSQLDWQQWNFTKHIVNKFWDRFCQGLSKYRARNPSFKSKEIPTIQERNQNILETLAYNAHPYTMVTSESVNNEIVRYYKERNNTNIGDTRLTQIRKELLDSGLFFVSIEDLNGDFLKLQFLNIAVMEYHAQTYKYKNLKLSNINATNFVSNYFLSNNSLERRDNEYLNLLLETSIIQSLNLQEKLDLETLVNNGYKKNQIKNSSLYQFMFNKFGDDGITKIDKELQLKTRGDLISILKQIFKHKQTKNKIKDKADDINSFDERLRTCNQIGSPQKQIQEILSNNENKLLLIKLLIDLAKNDFNTISDEMLVKCWNGSSSCQNIKEMLRKLSNLYHQNDQKVTMNSILKSIVLETNYIEIANYEHAFDIATTMSLLSTAFKQITPINDNSSILVIGDPGAGKSTTVCYYLGLEFDTAVNEFGQCIIQVKNNELEHQRSFPIIGHSLTKSETMFVQGYKIIKPLAELNESVNTITFCDCPGKRERRGLSYDLFTLFSINQAIKSSKSIKSVVLTIPFDTFFIKRAELVIESFEDLSKMFKNNIFTDKIISDSIYIVITKHNNYENADAKHLKKMIKDLITEDEYSFNLLSHDVDNKSNASKIRIRLNVLNMIKNKLADNQVFFIDITNIIERDEQLKVLIDLNNNRRELNKDDFNNIINRSDLQKYFVDCIKSSIDTWHLSIFESYIKITDDIIKKEFQISSLKAALHNLRLKTHSNNSVIEQAKLRIAELNSDLVQLQRLKEKPNFNEDNQFTKKIKSSNELLQNSRLQDKRIKFLKVDETIQVWTDKLHLLQNKINELQIDLTIDYGLSKELIKARAPFVSDIETKVKDNGSGYEKDINKLSEGRFEIRSSVTLDMQLGAGISCPLRTVTFLNNDEYGHLEMTELSYWSDLDCLDVKKYRSKRYPFFISVGGNLQLVRVRNNNVIQYSANEIGLNLTNSEIVTKTNECHERGCNIHNKTYKHSAFTYTYSLLCRDLNDYLIHYILLKSKKIIEKQLAYHNSRKVKIQQKIQMIEQQLMCLVLDLIIDQCIADINELHLQVKSSHTQVALDKEHVEQKEVIIQSTYSVLKHLNYIKIPYASIIKSQSDIPKLLKELSLLAIGGENQLGLDDNSKLSTICLDYIKYFDQNFSRLLTQSDQDLMMGLDFDESIDIDYSNTLHDASISSILTDIKDNAASLKARSKININLTEFFKSNLKQTFASPQQFPNENNLDFVNKNC